MHDLKILYHIKVLLLVLAEFWSSARHKLLVVWNIINEIYSGAKRIVTYKNTYFYLLILIKDNKTYILCYVAFYPFVCVLLRPITLPFA